ncbi:MAG TPA: HD domain-containing protein [Ignavibacteriales bacterium]|nr:HD domain-containing protein [Ignavibacteriales bacterium]
MINIVDAEIVIEKIKNINFLSIMKEVAKEEGYELYIVGGFIRDLFLGKNPNEIDFLVIGDGACFAEKVAQKFNINNVVIFKNFGTAYFQLYGYKLEFVGARKESYNRDSRKPIVENGTFDDDISRRDFTINAIALSINDDFKIIDKFSGIEDLKKGIIKTPIDPMITFDDDPLRILRAFRFASKLQFAPVPDVLNAATQLAERLTIVSQERITDEFLKILSSDKPSIGLKLLYQTKTLKYVFEELENLAGVEQVGLYAHKDVFLHTCQVVDNISQVTDNLWLRFAALVHDIGKPKTKKFVEGIGWTYHGHDEIGARMIKDIFKRLKLPYIHINYVKKLVRLHLRPIALAAQDVTDSAIRRLIVQAGDDLQDLITLCRADITSGNLEKVKTYLTNYDKVMQRVIEVQEKDKLRSFKSPIDGNEIMQLCNLKPGPIVGEIKKKIENAIIEGQISNTYEDAYNYLMSIKQKIVG